MSDEPNDQPQKLYDDVNGHGDGRGNGLDGAAAHPRGSSPAPRYLVGAAAANRPAP